MQGITPLLNTIADGRFRSTLLVQVWCRFKTALAPPMFAGEVGGSNPLAPIELRRFEFLAVCGPGVGLDFSRLQRGRKGYGAGPRHHGRRF